MNSRKRKAPFSLLKQTSKKAKKEHQCMLQFWSKPNSFRFKDIGSWLQSKWYKGMMYIHNEKNVEKIYLVYDLETTGKDPTSAKVVQFAVFAFSLEPFRVHYHFQSLVHQNYIPTDAAKIHGISAAQVRKAPFWNKVLLKWKEIHSLFVKQYPRAKFILMGYNNFGYDDIILVKQYEEIDSLMVSMNIRLFTDVYANGSKKAKDNLIKLGIPTSDRKLGTLFQSTFIHKRVYPKFKTDYTLPHIFPLSFWEYLGSVISQACPMYEGKKHEVDVPRFLRDNPHDAMVDILMTTLLHILWFSPDPFCMKRLSKSMNVISFNEWKKVIELKLTLYYVDMLDFPQGELVPMDEKEIDTYDNLINQIVI